MAQPVRRGPMGGHGPGAVEKPKDLTGTLRRLLNALGKYRTAFFAVLVFAALSTIFNIAGPKILAKATTALATGWYAMIYILLIIMFNYFYVAIQYNPVEMANNLQKNNGAIPGIRPGRPTTEFITRVISKITLVGALVLGLVATLPILLTAITGMNISLGGTSILIVVGVALDTVRQLESEMMMRHYKGFLE